MSNKKFLITYENGIYNFFSEDEVSYQLTLSNVFGTQILPRVELTTDILIDEYTVGQIDCTDLQIKEIISVQLKKNQEEEFTVFTDYTYNSETHIITFTETLEPYDILRLSYTDVEEFYVRSFADTNLKTVVLDIQTEGQSEIDFVVDSYVIQFNPDESFVLAEGQSVPHTFNVVGGQPKIVLTDSIPEQIRVQFSYYSSIPLVIGTEYDLEINEETPALSRRICQSNGNILYLGDYSYFMGDGEGTSDPDIIEVEDTYTQIDDYISIEERQYKIIFGVVDSENPQTPMTYLCEVGQLANVGPTTGPAAYVGNLSLYQDGQPDTGEPFCIITIKDEASEGSEDIGYETWLYVADSGIYKLLIEAYNVVLIPELVGAALVSLGRKINENGTVTLRDNYGIGINSSDDGLTLPERAISLFETELRTPTTEDLSKIKVNYRGILGTLPDNLLMQNNIKENMKGTQGIYTDNMYIGDATQYVAFYRDKKNNNEPRLDIKGNVYIGDETLNSVVNISNGAISLGNINGFHIHIDGNGDKDSPLYEEYTYGLGFYESSHNPYQLTGDTSVVSEKDYYSYDETTGRYIQVTPVGTEDPNAEGWYDKTDKRIAYINDTKLHIPYTVVLKGMELGTKWIWELQPDTNNLTLKWTGK